MSKVEAVQRIRMIGVVPVVRAASAQEAMQLAEAIRAGGLPVLEITLTVPGALQVIERLTRACGDEVLVGAGSVLDAASARACIAAGARFIVSPVLDRETVAYCREQQIAVIPGALTPTEVIQAWNAGADLVKVFPAKAMGGAGYIRALMAPMPQLVLVPTGGVTLANAAGFIEAGAAAIGVGSDLADIDAIRAGQAGRITAAARAYFEAVRAARRAAETQAGLATGR